MTVKSRVDGQLLDVHFKEGDLVHEGDPLIEIDPRPFQAVVEQTDGQLIRDQALLANARVDLSRCKSCSLRTPSPNSNSQPSARSSSKARAPSSMTRPLDAAKINVVYCHITSPITGIVGLRLVDPGNIVHARTPMA